MKEIVKSQPIYKQVYQNIKQAILTGKLKPGARVDITELASQFNISRTPLREALRQLETEGLLHQDYSGTSVVQLNKEDLQELCYCRLILEKQMIQLVIERISDEQLEDIQKLIDEAQIEYQKGNLMTTLENNTKFHESIILACPNKRLVQFLNYVRSLTLLYRAEVLKDDENVREMLEEHQAILNALKARDTSKAIKAVHEHLEHDQMRAIKLFDDQ